MEQLYNSYKFLNEVEIYKSKANDSEINQAPLSFDNLSKGFLVDNMKKTKLYGYVYDFLFDFDSIDVDDILDILKYLMEKTRYKKMFSCIYKCLLDYYVLSQQEVLVNH